MLEAPLLAVLLTVGGQRASADPVAGSKKAAYLASKAEGAAGMRGRRPARRGQRAQEPVFAHYWWTLETMPLEGPGITEQSCDLFFRCHFTQDHADIPPELVRVVVDTARKFDKRAVDVVSGFRHPKYNRWLRKKGREVALASKHTEGRAIDFQVRGVPPRELYRYLLATHNGGVGFYSSTGFVHVDTGERRTWRGT